MPKQVHLFLSFIVVVAILALPIIAGADGNDPNENLEPENLKLEGTISFSRHIKVGGNASNHQDEEPYLLIANNKEEFNKAVALSNGKSNKLEVDFKEEIVVFLFLGERRTSGYFVKVNEVYAFSKDGKSPMTIVVEGSYYSPHPYRPASHGRSSPWTMVKIKRKDLPARVENLQFKLLLRGTVYSFKDAAKNRTK